MSKYRKVDFGATFWLPGARFQFPGDKMQLQNQLSYIFHVYDSARLAFDVAPLPLSHSASR